MTQWTDAILDYHKPSAEDRRLPNWMLKLIVLLAMVAFPISYALFAVTLMIAPFLLLAGLVSALIGLTACTLTAAATFGSLWLIDYGLSRTSS